MKSNKFEFYFNSLQQIWNHQSKLEADVRSFENLGIFDFLENEVLSFEGQKQFEKSTRLQRTETC